MKTFTKLLAGVVTILALAMIGCQTDTDTHEHTYSSEWTSDATSHWHPAICEHTSEVSEKTAHTFDKGVVTKEATETETGIKTYTCTICKYEKKESIAVLPHTHKYSTEWTSDATNHWHAATCEHTTEVKDKATHSFNEGVVTKEATETEAGVKIYTCSVCEYKKTEAIPVLPSTQAVFVKIAGTEITGKETWTPKSEVFVSGRAITIPTLLVSDHEVTRGEFKDVMGTDPSKASAYDANGTKLTGDAVFNNPVNYVSWYDAIAYCNKLSIKEGLTPCYTVKDVNFSALEYSGIPTSRNSAWDAATCDFTADGYRLPTEAEWEYLARGGENYTYAGSDTVDDVAWYTSNIKDTGTREVKTKQANAYGLYDMSGNVWEWCWDLKGSINSTTDSAGSASGSYRVRRGGSWGSLDRFCAVSCRFSIDPYDRGSSCGLRVVRNAN